MPLDHEPFLRRAFDVARRSREGGDHPFGAILVGPDGQVLMEQGNGFSAEGHDMTAHAERLLATRASKAHDPDFLAGCTLYTSAEPCAMCAGAIYWAGIGRVVYGQAEASLKQRIGNHKENPTLDLPCRRVFAAGQRPTEVIGPLLEAEAAALQTGAWTSSSPADNALADLIGDPGLTNDDATHLRRSIVLAHQAVDSGNRPFGAVIVDRRGHLVSECYSTQTADHDWTAHAEMRALRVASTQLSWEELGGCTIYASGEPCPMCAAAMHWCNVCRLVFGLDELAMRMFRRGHVQGEGLAMSSREVLSRSPRRIEVIGPALVEEATAPHTRYWASGMTSARGGD